jgi:CRP-like cAMP-binding protein
MRNCVNLRASFAFIGAMKRTEEDLRLINAFFLRLEQHDKLRAEERGALLDVIGPVERLPGGASLVRTGERPGASTLLLSGMASRFRLLSDGGRQIVAIHVAGDFVDLHSFLLKEMDHDVATLAPSAIARVRHEALEELTRNYPHATRLLWLLTLIDAAIMREWAVSLGRRTALERMAHFFCEIHLRLLAVGLDGNDTFELPISQVTLSDILGLSVVHTNKQLQDLRARELIVWNGSTVRLLDRERLMKLADFDDLYLHRRREPR